MTLLRHRLLKAYPHIPGFIVGATVQETRKADHPATAFVSLDGEDYYPVARTSLDPLEADPTAFVCPYSAAFMTVGLLRWRSPVSTGVNSCDLRVSGDPDGHPVWSIAEADGKTTMVGTGLPGLLAERFGKEPGVAQVSLRAICGLTYNGADITSEVAANVLSECGITVMPQGAKLMRIDDPPQSLSCTLQEVA